MDRFIYGHIALNQSQVCILNNIDRMIHEHIALNQSQVCIFNDMEWYEHIILNQSQAGVLNDVDLHQDGHRQEQHIDDHETDAVRPWHPEPGQGHNN